MAREGFFESYNLNERGKFESGTKTCCGCQRVIILNPDRERARNYCRKCDSYMCDSCSLSFKVTGEHKSFDQVADEFLEAAIRGRPFEGELGGKKIV